MYLPKTKEVFAHGNQIQCDGRQAQGTGKSYRQCHSARAEYKFMPTCNYEIDYFTVTKDGTLLFDDRADSEEVERVLEAIAAAGFECEPQDCGEQPSREETKEAAESADTAPQGEPVGLTVEIPLDKVAVGNLTKLLDAKGNLIRKALGITDLHIEVLDDRVAFPWFAQVDADSSAAYTHLFPHFAR
mgnify:CR=1 FL=1